MNTLIRCFFVVAVCCTGLATAQTAPATATTTMLDLRATDTKGAPFNQDLIRGKVAIVFFWSTSCAVCRDSLPELRVNLNGWREKPFALVTVNVDKSANDWLSYERIQTQTQMPSKSLIAVRQDEGKAAPMKLPLTLLVDAKGKVVARYEGRLAPEAWDGVADLMP
ncbi:MAG: TlpA disulfide reductase family protein [Rhodoferax sp.]